MNNTYVSRLSTLCIPHSIDPQFSVKYGVPLQSSPPFSGVGLVQVLVYLLIPPVQLLLQEDILHEDHPPCTGARQIVYILMCAVLSSVLYIVHVYDTMKKHSSP